MRKAQKQQIEEMIRQMEEAHDEIKRCIEKENTAQAEELLIDCQNAAIAIGTLIEGTEGECHPAVTDLEEYCELVYQIHENLTSDCIANVNKIYKFLRQKLVKAQNNIRNNIKIRTEAVFLPYKASMWDSLESVWQAASEDPCCDAYVIPIPYYDKRPDGGMGQTHYEFDQYPEHVPVTRYEEYDFEARQPDMIFIHNPYDECNYVTSVHPFFYSRNLKRFTGKLVYIPYFVLGDINPDNPEALKGVESFCMVPGVLHADQVIVQSENMKKAYVKVLSEALEKQGLGKAHWEAKIQGLGSPKLDKALRTEKKMVEIPEEWNRLIERPDGSHKKIVFYNTGLTAMLKYNEQYLQKLRDVLRFFYENREDVTLLWRPHPLMKATMESMRPQLCNEYQKIVEQYQAEGWGIYDDTADMDRALALSDAYYGDGSSIVHLCREKGIPVMIQNMEVLSE